MVNGFVVVIQVKLARHAAMQAEGDGHAPSTTHHALLLCDKLSVENCLLEYGLELFFIGGRRPVRWIGQDCRDLGCHLEGQKR